jgi:hypothetical protein
MNPRPTLPGNGEIEGRLRAHGNITPEHGNGPTGKKRGVKKNGWHPPHIFPSF